MNYKKAGIIFYLCAIMFYVAAMLTFFFNENKGMGAMWMCLGSSWLCLGTVFTSKSKKENEEGKDEDKKDE